MDEYPQSQSIGMWAMLARRYQHNLNRLVVGADLGNEPRKANGLEPTWGTGDAKTDWRAAATACGDANTLLPFAARAPVRLHIPNKLVYLGRP